MRKLRRGTIDAPGLASMARGSVSTIALCLVVAAAACGGKTALVTSDGVVDPRVDAGVTGEQLPDATFIVPFHERPTPDRAWVPIALGLERVDLTIVMDTTG